MIWLLAGRIPLLLGMVRRIAPNPFRYLSGKALERWLLLYDLGPRVLALSNDPGIAETVMLDRNGTFPKSAALEALLRPLIGAGVFGQPGGKPVKEARRLFIRALARVSDEEIVRVCQTASEKYVQRWIANAPDQTVPICTELSRLTVDIVSECTLGTTFSADESARFARLFFDYHRKCMPLLLLLSDGQPGTTNRLIRSMGVEPIGAEMRRLMRDRFLSPLLAGDPGPLAAPFAESLNEAGLITASAGDHESAQARHDRALDEIAVMLLAGHETTASALSWLLWELAHRLDEQEGSARLLDHPPGTAGAECPVSGSNRRYRPQTDEMLDALAREALRLYPPIAFFLRETKEDLVFRGKAIRRGSFLVISPWTLHRHRKKWARPDDFAPERWLQDGHAPLRTAFMPFGMGPRTCPGAHFAAVEMREILRVILTHCRFAPAMTGEPKPLGSLTSRPDREIYLHIQPRETHPPNDAPTSG